MVKKLNLVFFVILSVLLLLNNKTFALETKTHQDINGYVANMTFPNGFNLNTYLKDNLGLSGVGEVLTENKKVEDWIKLGGHYEDKPPWTIPYRRSFNHYHNPLSNKGYLGIWNSSTQWVLMPRNTQSPGGYYSWYDVRNYYLQALTSQDTNTRNTNFAQTFRGLGQLMHLVQDASVPAHTRDDGHVAYNYENFAESFVNGQGVPTPTAANFFNGAVTNIATFIDTNQYTQSTPESALPSGNTFGLSEYTNANFFSEDTINAGNFTYPKISDTTTSIVTRDFTGMFGIVYPRLYYLKKCCGEMNGINGVANGYLLSTVDFLHDYRVAMELAVYQPEIPILDDNVYTDYASFLLPRAVGYSAGLLNYFFRGKVDMIKDPNNSSQYVIKNESNELISGVFSLYYDDAADNRYPVQGASWSLSINPNSTSSPVAFTAPASPAPKEQGKYILVFQGALGNESGAVAARVVKLTGGWSFLLIKQISIESDVIEKRCSGCTAYSGGFIDTVRQLSGYANWNSYVLKFELEWLGDVNEITNVALISGMNPFSCQDYIPEDFSANSGLSISLTQTTATNPKGHIEVSLKGSQENWWPFPKFIRVDTVDAKGEPKSFYEPIFTTYNHLYSESQYDTGQYADYYKWRGIHVGVDIGISRIPCAHARLNANYSLDLSSLKYANFWFSSPYEYFYHVKEWHWKTYKRESPLPLFPHTVEKMKIKRVWKQSVLNYLESVGYDINHLPNWDIILDYWMTDYRP